MIRLFSPALMLLALVQAATGSPKQAPVVADGLMSGRVVDGGDGRPVAGVVVILLQRPAPGQPPVSSTGQFGGLAALPSRILVDAGGRFTFTGLKPGTYELQATRRGYVSGAIGKLRVDGTGHALELAEHGRHTDLTLRVWKHASIAGIVVDEANEPVVGVSVYAHRREWMAGEMRLVMTGTGATTDDRGAFRIGSLLAGEYLVSVPTTQRTIPASMTDVLSSGDRVPDDIRSGISLVSSSASAPGSAASQRIGEFVLHTPMWSVINPEPAADGRVSVYQTAYYPGSPGGADRPPLALATGEAKTIPPIQLRPVVSVRVFGTLSDQNGPSPLTTVTLLPQNIDSLAGESGFEAARTITDSAGRFTFLGVTPGTYRLVSNGAVVTVPPDGLHSVAHSTTATSSWTTETIAVGASDVALTLSLKPALRITGTVVFDGQAPQPRPDQISRYVVTLAPADGRQVTESSGRDPGAQPGSFIIQDLAGGRYVLRTSTVPAGWSLKWITRRGQDVIDTPIDVTDNIADVIVTFTDRPASVRGAVRTAAGAVDSEAFVILMPQDSRRWTHSGRAPIRMRGSRIGAGGTYAFTNVPPGDYLVAAIHDAAAGNWQNPKFLDGLSRAATRVQINDGASITQDLVRVAVK